MNPTDRAVHVVLLFGAAVEDRRGSLESESSRLDRLLEESAGRVDISVISRGLGDLAGASRHVRLDGSGQGPLDRVLVALGAIAVRRRLAARPLGRLLNSLGPVDPGRVFWRTIRRNREAMRLLKSADLVIATDQATTKTAWLAVHRGWVEGGFYDRRSAGFASTNRITGSP